MCGLEWFEIYTDKYLSEYRDGFYKGKEEFLKLLKNNDERIFVMLDEEKITLEVRSSLKYSVTGIQGYIDGYNYCWQKMNKGENPEKNVTYDEIAYSYQLSFYPKDNNYCPKR